MLNKLRDQCHEVAKQHGWWDGERNIPEVLCLIHSEISEALECFRNGQLATVFRASDHKPEGLPSELADVIIRLMDLCGYLGTDIDREVWVKQEYNKKRQWRHGGKKA